MRPSKEQYRAIFENSQIGIYRTTPDGLILLSNPALIQMWGYARSEVLQVSVGQLSAGEPPYSQNEFFEWIARARSGAAQLFEWKARHKNGRAFWTEVNMRRAAIGDLDVVLMVVRDIGERKRAEQMQLATYRISELVQTTKPCKSQSCSTARW